MNTLALYLALLIQLQGSPQPAVRAVTVTAIPGVIAAGARWEVAWQGTDNADGIIGVNDGGLLFAQEQPNQVRKLDTDGRVSLAIRDTHGAGALSIDPKGRIVAALRTCTDP
jgi:gluconolactonase